MDGNRGVESRVIGLYGNGSRVGDGGTVAVGRGLPLNEIQAGASRSVAELDLLLVDDTTHEGGGTRVTRGEGGLGGVVAETAAASAGRVEGGAMNEGMKK